MKKDDRFSERVLQFFVRDYSLAKRSRAQQILSNQDQTKRLLHAAQGKAKANKASLGGIWELLQNLFHMMYDWVRGDYRKVPFTSLLMIVIGFLYFLSPADLITDLLPGVGFLDDAVVLGFILKQISSDIEQYKLFKEQQADPSGSVGDCVQKSESK